MTEAYQGPTPPPELVEEWLAEACKQLGPYHEYVAIKAANWGYQQAVEELEAFVKKGEDKQ